MEEQPRIELPTPDSSGCATAGREPSRVGCLSGTRPPLVYQALVDPTAERPWSLVDDCNRVRDLARKHGFMIRARDAKEVWERRSKLARSSWLPLPESDDQLFQEMIKHLHDWLADDVEQLPTPSPDALFQAAALRPPLIDLQDGPCEICDAWSAKAGQRDEAGRVIVWCQGCGDRILGMEHNSNRGVQGVVPHHYHMTMVNGSVPGRKGIFQELCLECAIALRLKVYPPDDKDKHGNYNPTAEQMRSYKG